MEKFGFVYIWYDKKRKMYYIGCHWGTENDGYKCSSNRMRNAYRRRPQDFKRKILAKVYTNRNDLLEEEYKWLSSIKEDKLGKKYYNLRKCKWGHWSEDENKRLTVSQKISQSPNRRENISKALKGKYIGENNPLYGIPRSEEWKANFSKNHPKPMLGKTVSEKTRLLMSIAATGKSKPREQVEKSAKTRTGQKRSKESRIRMSNAQKNTKKPWVKGRAYIKDNEKFKENMRNAALLREKKKREKRIINIKNEDVKG